MQYALMLYVDPEAAATLTTEERETVETEFAALADDPRLVVGARLQPSEMATNVRLNGGRTVTTDGPFADTKEVIGGLAIIEADNLDDAIELASRIPAIRTGGVEIRPLIQP